MFKPNHSTQNRQRTLLFAILAVVIVAALMARRSSAQTDGAAVLQDAWQNTERAGNYEFRTEMTETTLPAPRISSAGRQASVATLFVEGRADRSAQQLDLKVWDDATTALDQTQAIELRIDGLRAEGRTAGGEWQQVDDISGAFAPAGDAAAFLSAATNVRSLGSETRDVPTARGDMQAVTFERYAFSLDGDQYADQMRAMMQQQLRDNGDLPHGVSLGANEVYRNMVTEGEAWIDSNGLPLRIMLDMEQPQESNGERTLMTVKTDFVEYSDRAAVTKIGIASNPFGWITQQVQWSTGAVDVASVVTATVLLSVTGGVLAVGWFRPKQSYNVFATVLSAQMAFAPLASLVDSHNIDQFYDQFPHMRPIEKDRDANVLAQLAAAGQETASAAWDSLTSPLEAGRASYADDEATAAAAGSVLYQTNAGRAPASTNETDTDNDGLPDHLETLAFWETSPNNPDTDGDGVADGAEAIRCPFSERLNHADNFADLLCSSPRWLDTDSDGLTDGEEILYLATFPNAPDSDGDGIDDYVEVHGFLLNGVRHYLNPLDPDMDNDGRLDGFECPELLGIDKNNWTDQLSCQASANGTADVLSIDDDGDGVPTRSDASPDATVGTTFNADNPLNLKLDSLAQDKPVLVDIQIRPTEVQHLSYALNVLDWPTGDSEGQLQRRVDSTFGDLSNAPLDHSSHNGDMRITPMLTFELPGNSQDLPRTNATHTVAMQDSGQLVGAYEFSANEPPLASGSIVKMTAGSGTPFVEILDGGCSSTTVEHSVSLSNGQGYGLGGQTLAKVADGKHAMRVTVNDQAYCQPIPSMATGASAVSLSIRKQPTTLGTVTLTQAGTDHTQIAFSGLSNSYDAIFRDSCDGGTSNFTLDDISNGAVEDVYLNAVEIANGSEVIDLVRNSKRVACVSLGNIVNGAGGGITMIDHEALLPYEISVHETDSGTLSAMIPLSLVQDGDTGERVAFGGRMLFNRQTAAQLNATVNLTWLVTMLTDTCPAGDCANGVFNQSQIVHQYQDESWRLTGLNVQEELGGELALIYEDPEHDESFDADDNLWWLAHGLQRSFLIGRSGNNTSRDIDVAEIDRRWDTTQATESQRFSLDADAFNVETVSFEGIVDMALQSQAAVNTILTDRFTPSATVPDNVAPTILMAREQENRSLSLDALTDNADEPLVTVNGNTVALNLATDDVVSITTAAMNWAPFRQSTSGDWEAFPIVDYYEKMEATLISLPSFANGAITGESGDDIGNVAEVRVAQAIYLSFYAGMANVVKNGSGLTFDGTVDTSDLVGDDALSDFLAAAGVLSGGIGGKINAYVSKLVLNDYLPARQAYTRAKLNAKTADRSDGFTSALYDIALGDAKADLELSRKKASDGMFAQSTGTDGWLNSRLAKGGQVALFGASILAGVALSFTDPTSENSAERAVALTAQGILTTNQLADGAKLVQAFRVFQAGPDAAEKGFMAFSGTQKMSKAAKIGGAILLGIEIGLSIGLFVYSIISADIGFMSLAFRAALSVLIASTVIAVLLFALAFTGIGAIVVAIIGIIDGLIALICGLAPPDRDSDDIGDQIATWVCKGISGLMAELVAYLIYDQTDLVTIDDADRLKFIGFNPHLQAPEDGFVTNAVLEVDVRLVNTLQIAPYSYGLGGKYFYQYSKENLRESSFEYDIVASEETDEDRQIHASVEPEAHIDAWQAFEGSRRKFYIERTVSSDDAIKLPTPGINQTVDAYFAEGYSIPVQECAGVGLASACWVTDRSASSYNDLGLVFDVFPKELTDFYTLTDKDDGKALAWRQSGSTAFPRLWDADGDGLSYQLDLDDARADIDGDGINDLRESQLGTDPSKSDSDQDGLDDDDELRFGSNPMQADSDSDGLNDSDERDGWMLTYNAAGDRTRVWSDVNSADSDNDNIYDKQEKALGYHPHVANAPFKLDYQVELRETDAPLLLLHMDERANTSTFVDDAASNSLISATCDEACPISGVFGRIGNAAHFNGNSDHLLLDNAPHLGILTNDFTVAAWVKQDSAGVFQRVIGSSLHNTRAGWRFGTLNGKLNLTFARLHGFNSEGEIPIGEWTHIAAVARRVTTGTEVDFYINGTFDSMATFGGADARSAQSEPYVVGAIYKSSAVENEPKPLEDSFVLHEQWHGSLDEIAVFGKPLDATGIEHLRDGRYNPADGVTKSTDELEFETRVTNDLLGRRIEGLLTREMPGALSYAKPIQNFVVQPNSAFVQTDSLNVRWTPSGTYTITQDVSAIIDVPTVPVPNQSSGQVYAHTSRLNFDGRGKGKQVSNGVRLDNTDFTISLWVYPTDLDTYRQGVFGWNSGEINGYPSIQVEDSGYVRFGFGDGSNWHSVKSTQRVFVEEKWTHLAISFERNTSTASVFVDGDLKDTLTFSGTPTPSSTGGTEFNIGRSTNIGRIAYHDVYAICEDDNEGSWIDLTYREADGSYGNLWSAQFPDDVEDLPENSSLRRQPGRTAPHLFHDSIALTMCENDTDESSHSTCDSDDDFMGSVAWATWDAPASGRREFYTSNDPACAWDEGYDDWVDVSYGFENNAIPFEGSIKDLRIFDTTKTDVEITNLTQSANRISFLRLNDRPGSTYFEDDVAVANAACSDSNWQWGWGCPVSGVDGRDGTAAYFDGLAGIFVQDMAEKVAGYHENTLEPKLSMSAWVKPDSPEADYQHIMGFLDPNDSTNRFYVGLLKDQNNSGLIPFIGVGIHTATLMPNIRPISPNVHGEFDWTHVSVEMEYDDVTDKTTIALWINGWTWALNNSTFDGKYLPPDDSLFSIGGSFDNQWYLAGFKGSIDEVMIGKDGLSGRFVMDLAPQKTYKFDEDSSVAAISELPLVAGQIHGARQFDGISDKITNASAGSTNLINNDFTFSGWVYGEELVGDSGDVFRPILATTNPNNTNEVNGVLGLKNGIPFARFDSNIGADTLIEASFPIPPRLWTHLAFRRFGDEFKIYVNGTTVKTATHDRTEGYYYSTAIALGGGYMAGTGGERYFSGALDEISLHNRALLDEELIRLYNLQVTSFDASDTATFTVDNDLPTATLKSLGSHIAPAPTAIVIETNDATSRAASVRVKVSFWNVQHGYGGHLPELVAGACEDAELQDVGTFCALFTPSSEGTYTLQPYAIDRVGNIGSPSDASAISVDVDASAPILSVTPLPQTPFRPDPSEDAATWSIGLSGQVWDIFSSVASVDVTLYDANGALAGTPPTQPATIDSGNWSSGFIIKSDNPTGAYTGTVKAWDAVGNETTVTIPRFELDTTDPQATVTNLGAPTALGGNTTLQGVVTELPDSAETHTPTGIASVQYAIEPVMPHGSAFVTTSLSSDIKLFLPLDKSGAISGTVDSRFSDLVTGIEATCSDNTCPASGIDSRDGQAVSFDGVDDVLVLPNSGVNELTNDFTVAAWIKPTDFDGFGRIVGTSRANSANGFGFARRGRALRLDLYGVHSYLAGNHLVANVWQHVAVHLDSNNDANFYLNGVLVETVAHTAPAIVDPDDTLLIGAGSANGNATTTDHFTGAIDSVMVATGKPTGNDWEAIFGLAPTLHLTFDDRSIQDGDFLSDRAKVGSTTQLTTGAYQTDRATSSNAVGSGALEFVNQDQLSFTAPLGVLPRGNNSYSIAVWVRGDGAGVLSYGRNGYDRIHFDGYHVIDRFDHAFEPANANDWTHFVFVWDESEKVQSIYRNGNRISGFMFASGNGLEDDETVMTYTYNGASDTLQGLDDLRVYQRALSAGEIDELAQTGWHEAATSGTRAANAASDTWSAGLPDNLEGFYNLRVRASDVVGNIDEEPKPAFSGIIDTIAPRVSIDSEQVNGQWQYTLVAQDFNLKESTLSLPQACEANSSFGRSYYAGAWYLALEDQIDENIDKLTELSVICETTSQLAPSASFAICDEASNCSGITVDGTAVPTSVTLANGSSAAMDVWQGAGMASIALLAAMSALFLRKRREDRNQPCS